MCIGNTALPTNKNRRSTVYPYVYREHMLEHIGEYLNDGLSLCVQGTLIHAVSQIQQDRFIPMCIGNTAVNSSKNNNNAVYPYVYREHKRRADFSPNDAGLSLCVQGTQVHRQ